MKKIILFYLFTSTLVAQNNSYQRLWGTYFGDERFYLKDSETDKEGNLYIVGGFAIGTSATTPIFNSISSYQPNFNGGSSDGFIAKFNNSGLLEWATYFGGENTDIIFGIDVDSASNIYIVGLTYSQTNISQSNAQQTTLNGSSDFLIAKFSTNGQLITSTYFGGVNDEGTNYDSLNTEEVKLNISHDKGNNFYIAGSTDSPNIGNLNTFQPMKLNANQIIAKFDNNLTSIWTTYYGTNNNNYICDIYATPNSLYVRGRIYDCPTNSGSDLTYYGTLNGQQPIQQSCVSSFLTKFSSNGQREWSTYYGGLSSTSNKSIAVLNDKVYFTGAGRSSTISTTGVFQETVFNNDIPGYLVQFTENGSRDWGTFCGTNAGFNNPSYAGSNHVTISNDGSILLSGRTLLFNNISTLTGFQVTKSIGSDGYICKFDNQGQKIWGSYYGSESSESDLVALPTINDHFYTVGYTYSQTNLTTSNSYQQNFATYDSNNGVGQNIFISYFEPIQLKNQSFRKYDFAVIPNPNNGNFKLQFENTPIEEFTIELVNILGQVVYKEQSQNSEIELFNFEKGLYLLKVSLNDGITITRKIIIK